MTDIFRRARMPASIETCQPCGGSGLNASGLMCYHCKHPSSYSRGLGYVMRNGTTVPAVVIYQVATVNRLEKEHALRHMIDRSSEPARHRFARDYAYAAAVESDSVPAPKQRGVRK